MDGSLLILCPFQKYFSHVRTLRLDIYVENIVKIVIVYCMLTMYVLCTHGPNGLLYSLI